MWLRVSEYTTSSLLLSDLREQAIEIREIGYVACTLVALFLDLFDRRRWLALAAPGHENVCALLGEQLCRCQSRCRYCRQLQARFF